MHITTVQGVEVPTLGYGTWQLTGSDCEQGVEHALRSGYRHVDTAQMYENEDRVGAGMSASGVDRGEVFLTTKISNDNHAREDVLRSTDESLARLGTDYVDLLLIHWPLQQHIEVPLSETLEAMRELADQGKARNLGVSNFTPSQLAEARGQAPILCNQVECHPYFAQRELHQISVEQDLLLTAYSPLARGDVMDDETLTEIGEAHDAGPVEVALRWLIQRDHVAAIPKATSPEHIDSNLQALEIELSDEEMQRIDELDRGRRIIDPDFAPDWEGPSG